MVFSFSFLNIGMVIIVVSSRIRVSLSVLLCMGGFVYDIDDLCGLGEFVLVD